jgi:hypothetical protein
VIVIRGLADESAVALGAHDLGVQQYLHANFAADFVQRELHRLGVDGKEHAAKLYRAACAPDLTEFLDNLSGDAQHCRLWLVADGVEATIGLHALSVAAPPRQPALSIISVRAPARAAPTAAPTPAAPPPATMTS